MPALLNKPLPVGVRAELFNHLAAMEQAGVPAERSFASLQLPAAFGSRLERMRRHLDQGRDLASAGALAELFTPLEVSLLQAAQTAGSPAPVYRRLAEGYAVRERERKQVRARLLMPAAVLLLALFIQPLPALIGGSLGIAGYVWAVLAPLLLVAALVVGVRWLLARLEQPARGGDGAGRLLRALPLLGPAYLRRNARDFFDSLGLLLGAGVPMLDALPRACSTLSNAELRAQFERLAPAIAAGQSLGPALRELVDFPGKAKAVALVTTGEGSGTLADMLLTHARHESQALADFQEQLATWLPRLGYLLVVLWIAYGLLTGGGFSPQLPPELR
ncbi:type II secretion system F family protein [Pseudomonas mangrovi]|uniref:Type II secretion system protein n=1 Tax=Pseudomonas mangrovi TaxID=2161748 RepID=A0A2T5PFB4_9PSED|nr:type II secretion system F family protein [Pseudomonas mangrovi]PTU76418.1 type II secretion system protein [Pseudomonas mangrovi]